MEHRWMDRKKVDWELVVYDGDRRLGRARARNISRQGIMLDGGRLKMPAGNVLELFCSVPLDKGRRVIRLQGQVVHSSERHVGLMWTDRVDGVSLDSSIHAAESTEPGTGGTGFIQGSRPAAG